MLNSKTKKQRVKSLLLKLKISLRIKLAALILLKCTAVLFAQAPSTSTQPDSSILANKPGRSQNIFQKSLPRNYFNFNTENVLAKIEQCRYSIYYNEPGQVLQSFNRANNMYITYHAGGFEAWSLKENESWYITMKIKGLYRGNLLAEFPIPSRSTAGEINLSGNQLVYHYNSLDVEYINTVKGMRQNFIVHQNPEGSGPLKVNLEVQAENLALQCNGKELRATQNNSIKYSYHDLKVWDADNKQIPATMELKGCVLALVVDDRNAHYPITIDPLSTTPASILESNQAGSLMGYSVASAGDVNGDGYSDVIVGAYSYDNGEVDEGAAFIYHGSVDGVSNTPAATIQSNQADANFGYSVAAAGDVNGDGYSDVIVGTVFY